MKTKCAPEVDELGEESPRNRIGATIYDRDWGFHEIELYACPECGTVRIKVMG